MYVPVGGKKLLTFLDDMNMPAKDTFGSQPPLELIRQWIDYGFWYDRAKQTVKQIKVLLPCICYGMFNGMLLIICIVGHVSAGLYGPTRWREDGHLKTTTEQIQPHQHDLPTGTYVAHICNCLSCRGDIFNTCFLFAGEPDQAYLWYNDQSETARL